VGKNIIRANKLTGGNMAFDQGGYPPQADQTDLLGDIFRAHRMAAGVSIEQVEYDLRIKAKYLEAIEDSDAAALPSRAYVDGFIRNYAAYLGLDPTAAVDQFTVEHGQAPSNIPAVPIPPKSRSGSDTSGLGMASTRGKTAERPLRRALVAAMPLLLVGGMGVAGYTGFVAARDAGLIPDDLVAAASGIVGQDEEAAPDRLASAAEETIPAPIAEPAVADDDSAADAPEPATRVALVGSEPLSGRPDSLRYARVDATPYWRARPPAIDPVDGPVSDIEPEKAGVLRAEPEASRWSSQSIKIEPTADLDARRIAAEAREALLAVLGPKPSETVETVENAPAANPDGPNVLADTVPAGLTTVEEPVATAETVFDSPTVSPLIPVEPGPAVPAQPPRRFALVATADTWVQITDGFGTVAYTGILSSGEAYNIPQRSGLRLRTGNAGGLFIEVDGERFGPLGNSGAIMRNVPLDPGAVRASFTLSRAASLRP
jgi:cytoskeletal protein RodZ